MTDIVGCDKFAKSLYVLGIQPKSVTLGEPMSPEVESARNELVELFENMFSAQ